MVAEYQWEIWVHTWHSSATDRQLMTTALYTLNGRQAVKKLKLDYTLLTNICTQTGSTRSGVKRQYKKCRTGTRMQIHQPPTNHTQWEQCLGSIMQVTVFYRLQRTLQRKIRTLTIFHNQRKFWICIMYGKQVETNYYPHWRVSVIVTAKW